MSRSIRYCLTGIPLLTLVATLPALLMATSKGGSAAFYLILVCALMTLAGLPRRSEHLKNVNAILTAALGLSVLAVVISQWVNGTWSGSEFERALRLMLGLLLVFAALRRMPAAHLRWPIVGAIAACWITATAILSLAWQSGGRPQTEEYNAVTYGNLTLLFGVLVVYSLGWRLTRWRRTEMWVKLVSAAAAFSGFLLTETRTGWLAVPLFVLVGVALFNHRTSLWRGVALGAVIMVAVAAVGTSSPALRQRAEAGVQEVDQCRTAPLTDSSMCIRLQLWSAAWHMFERNPLTGVGGGKPFVRELQNAGARGEVSAFVAENFGEPHNDMLYALATSGILGGLALLAVYLAPAWLFMRRLLIPTLDTALRVPAAMGLAVCLGFALFGTTELMFRGMRTVSFYAVTVAWLLAATYSATPARVAKDGAGG